VNALYRVTYLILSASILFLYYGCSSSSGTSRYGNNSDDSETKNTSVRYSSEDDEDSGDLPDDDAVDYGVVLDKYDLDTDENNFETGTPKEKMLMEIIIVQHLLRTFIRLHCLLICLVLQESNINKVKLLVMLMIFSLEIWFSLTRGVVSARVTLEFT
jgi:hypothetical protein